jgi:DNA-binding XRE family transcriptional regulator
MPQNILGSKIKKLCKLKSITQTELAETVGYSAGSAVNQIILCSPQKNNLWLNLM